METTFEPLPTPIIDDNFLKSRPLSYSSLKHFDISPKDYIHYLTAERKPSDAQVLGKAIEAQLFEKDSFGKRFHIYSNIDKRTNAGKAEWAKLITQAAASKMTLISEDEYAKAVLCAEAVMSNDKTRVYIEHVTRTQTKLEWTEKKYNLPMIGYSDMEGEYNGDFVGEFKTTQDASQDGWIREAYKWGYHLQIGTYSLGYHKRFFRFPNYFFILCETQEPYKSNIFFCDPKYLEQCREEIDYLLVSFRYCMDENLFSQGYEFWMQSMPYHTMKLPGYAKLRSL